MISVIIFSYNEPKATERAVKAFLEQNIPNSGIIVSDPYQKALDYLKSKFGDKIKYDLDFGEGKSAAFERLVKQAKGNIIISTDGDVYVGKNSIKNIIEAFKDEKMGAVCGKVVSVNPQNKMLGYWSHLLFEEQNKTRERLSKEGKFFQFSGYLSAFRNGVIKDFSLETAEDRMIPLIFYKKGYKLGFVKDAKIFILNAKNWKDWINQKVRNIKGQKSFNDMLKKENIENYYGLSGEIMRGLKFVFSYVKTPKEFVWMALLAFSRLYVWLLAYWDIKVKKNIYKDGWRGEVEIESAKPLD